MSRLRIWLVNTWETLPFDSESVRLRRTGLLAQALRDKGHEVTWWTSAFNHQRKQMRFDVETVVEIEERYRIVAVPALGYSRNLSLRRLRDHAHVAKHLKQCWVQVPKPDVLVASYPTIDAAYAAVEFGVENGIPVVVDIVDQWPDTFLDLAPHSFRSLMQLALAPLNRKSNEVFRKATALMANGPAVVQWAVNRSGRKENVYDQYFPMSYPDTPPSRSDLDNAKAFWREKGIKPTDFLIVFVGTLGRHFEFGPLLDAARTLLVERLNVKFVICGEGPGKEALMANSWDLPNVIFPGWIDYPEIFVLLRWASLGIAPYKPTPNFRNGIPNKPIEYLSAALPILMPFAEGYLWELLREWGCGLVYDPHDSATLVDAIRSVYKNGETRIQMSKSAQRLFDSHFRFETVYERMVQVIEQIASVSVNGPIIRA